MRRKIICLALALCMVFAMLPVMGGAADIVASGSFGTDFYTDEEFTWTLDSDGVLTISGNGAMKDFIHAILNNYWNQSEYGTDGYPIPVINRIIGGGGGAGGGGGRAPVYLYQPWGQYRKTIKRVVIEQGVTKIGAGAFYSCKELDSVVISESVTEIGVGAFMECQALTKAELPESVTIIGNHAFDGCSLLENIRLPSGLTRIGDWAFYGCENIKTVTVPENATEVGAGAFAGCSSLTAINTDSKNRVYTSLDGVLFTKDKRTLVSYPKGGRSEYTVPSGTNSIGNHAFYGCSPIVSVVMPLSVTSIGDRAFENCSSLMSAKIPSGVTSIGKSAFCNCSSLETAEIPGSVENVGESAFLGSGLKSVKMSAGVKSIGDYSFENCKKLISVNMPMSTESIGDYAFADCNSLATITITKNVTNIGLGAFEGCPKLLSINVDPYNPLYTSCDGVLFKKDMKTLLMYPGGKEGAYTIPDGVSSIGENAFEYCTKLSHINIPESITEIGNRAFEGCSHLTTAVIPKGVERIGDDTFFACISLESVTIPSSVKSVGRSAFGYASNITDVYYTGSETEWKSIIIDGDNNYLQSATIHFNYDPNARTDPATGERIAFLCKGDTLTVFGDVSQTSPVCIAVYDAGRNMIFTKVIEESASVDVSGGTKAKIIWVNCDSFTPKSECIEFDLN